MVSMYHQVEQHMGKLDHQIEQIMNTYPSHYFSQQLEIVPLKINIRQRKLRKCKIFQAWLIYVIKKSKLREIKKWDTV